MNDWDTNLTWRGNGTKCQSCLNRRVIRTGEDEDGYFGQGDGVSRPYCIFGGSYELCIRGDKYQPLPINKEVTMAMTGNTYDKSQKGNQEIIRGLTTEQKLGKTIVGIIAGSVLEVCPNCGDSIQTHSPAEIADQIHTLTDAYYKEKYAGYVKLAKDQSLPKTINNKQMADAFGGYDFKTEDMRAVCIKEQRNLVKEGWRRVEKKE